MSGQEASRGSGAAILLVLVIGVIVLCALSGNAAQVLELNVAAPNDHAVEKHGVDAAIAVSAIQNGCDEFCKYTCNDGRTRMVTRFKDSTDGIWKWAVVVEVAGVNITAFTTGSQDYIQNMLMEYGCTNGWNGGHP